MMGLYFLPLHIQCASILSRFSRVGEMLEER